MKSSMQPKKILLGISGGIAAYKIPELVRLLVADRHEVAPVLTSAARKFVTEHTLSALTSHRVRTELWDLEAERAMGHIELAKWPDTFVIAPASANTLAKLTNGLCDDLLSTTYLATNSPVVLVPSMNVSMWQHPATQRNVKQLEQDGVNVMEPAYGDQACGDSGPGRMPEPSDILNYLISSWTEEKSSHLLQGLKVLVTAGPTRERIDPVRFLSNRSSGKQGFEVARAAMVAGADVTLICGPVELQSHPRIERINVQTAAEMKTAVMNRAENCDVLFAVAAVADYQPHQVLSQKLKRPIDGNTSNYTLKLTSTDDIVQAVTKMSPRPFVVGFAAETHDVLQHASEKLKRKNMDAIIVNDVSDPAIGFESDENQVTAILPNTRVEIGKQSKRKIAQHVIEIVANALPKKAT